MKVESVSFAALTFLALLSAASFAQDRASPVAVPAQAPPSAARQAAPAAAQRSGAPAGLLIGAGDLLDVGMYGMPDFKAEVRVNSGGEISLPMLGTVLVGGLPVEKAGRLIERQLIQMQLFNDPHIMVFVKEYATQGISVLGEVQKAGIYPLLGSKTLYDVISAAGGTTPKAGKYVLITHRNEPQRAIRVALGAPESVENNVRIEPGDTVVVSKAGLVYVVGNVRQPGGFVMENDRAITVLQALALAQGAGPNAALNAAKLIRKTPAGPEEVPLPLKKILAAKAPDLQLQPDDIVFVPGSAGMSAAKRGAEAALQMATGVAIWRIP